MLCANAQPRNTYRTYCAIECSKRQTCNQINSSCSVNEQEPRNESALRHEIGERYEGGQTQLNEAARGGLAAVCPLAVNVLANRPARRELAPGVRSRPQQLKLTASSWTSLPLEGMAATLSCQGIFRSSAMARSRREARSAGRRWQDTHLKLSQALIRGKIFT